MEYLRISKKQNSDGSMNLVVILRFTKRDYYTYQSIHEDNEFFMHTDLNGRCNSHQLLFEIIKEVWFWVNLISVNQAVN